MTTYRHNEEWKALRWGMTVGAVTTVGFCLVGLLVLNRVTRHRAQHAACREHEGVAVLTTDHEVVLCGDGTMWGHADGYVLRLVPSVMPQLLSGSERTNTP
jgi:hypothetical protein